MAGSSEGSGCSGRVGMGITGLEISSGPVRKCGSLNADKGNAYGIPTQVFSVSDGTYFDKKELLGKLKAELCDVRLCQWTFGLRESNVGTVSASNDVGCCDNGRSRIQIGNFGKGKNLGQGSHRGNKRSRSSSEKVKTAKQGSKNGVLMEQCEKLLKQLIEHPHGWVFKAPVDVVKLDLPDYYDFIKHPMDLGTVKSKIASGVCQNPLEFAADVRLTFRNAMAYNPQGSDVYNIAIALSRFFEARWKPIERKLPPTDSVPLLENTRSFEEIETPEPVPPLKKRKLFSIGDEVIPEPRKCLMAVEEKHKIRRELESLIEELPTHIIDFLKKHSSSGTDSDDEEIEIDIDVLTDEKLVILRKLLDDYIRKKERNESKSEPCELEVNEPLNESGPTNLYMQQYKGNGQADEEIDIGGTEPPVSSCPSVDIEKHRCHKNSRSTSSSSSSDSETSNTDSKSEGVKDSSLVDVSKEQKTISSSSQLTEKTCNDDSFDRNRNNASFDEQVHPEKQYRHALLRSRFADTIIKAQEKTMAQGNKADPQKVCREKEELELKRKKEKARLQAEAKAAEETRRRAEEAEARRKRELEREAARQALLKVVKTVEINENSRFLKDLEMLTSNPMEHLPNPVDETSPYHSSDGLGGFKLGDGNPLEQLGLFMKEDEEDESEPDEID